MVLIVAAAIIAVGIAVIILAYYPIDATIIGSLYSTMPLDWKYSYIQLILPSIMITNWQYSMNLLFSSTVVMLIIIWFVIVVTNTSTATIAIVITAATVVIIVIVIIIELSNVYLPQIECVY